MGDTLAAIGTPAAKARFVHNRHDYFAPGGHESFQKIKQHRFSASKVFCFGMNQQESHRQKIQNSCADLQTRNRMQAEIRERISYLGLDSLITTDSFTITE